MRKSKDDEEEDDEDDSSGSESDADEDAGTLDVLAGFVHENEAVRLKDEILAKRAALPIAQFKDKLVQHVREHQACLNSILAYMHTMGWGFGPLPQREKSIAWVEKREKNWQ